MSESGRELRPLRSTKVPSRYKDMPAEEEFGENPSYGAIRERRRVFSGVVYVNWIYCYRTRTSAGEGGQQSSPTKAGNSEVDVMLDYPSDHESAEKEINYVRQLHSLTEISQSCLATNPSGASSLSVHCGALWNTGDGSLR